MSISAGKQRYLLSLVSCKLTPAMGLGEQQGKRGEERMGELENDLERGAEKEKDLERRAEKEKEDERGAEKEDEGLAKKKCSFGKLEEVCVDRPSALPRVCIVGTGIFGR